MRATVEQAVASVRAGGVVVVVDSADRENEGDLIMAAEHATPEIVAFFLRLTSGVLCVALTAERAAELELPPMVSDNRESLRTAYTVSADHRGVTTGISASDRSLTVRALATRASAVDLVRPGHVFPLVARAGGVLERPGHTESAVELARLAGCSPAGLLAEVTTDDKRSMASRAELLTIAKRWDMPLVTVEDIAEHVRSR